jgi:hypothetical protein
MEGREDNFVALRANLHAGLGIEACYACLLCGPR